MTGAVKGLVATLAKLRAEGKIDNRIAMMSVADQFGIGLAKAARRVFKKNGFVLVYDRSYALYSRYLDKVHGRSEAARAGYVYRFQLSARHDCAHRAGPRLELQPRRFFIPRSAPRFRFMKSASGGDAEGVMGIGGWAAPQPREQGLYETSFGCDRPRAGWLGQPCHLCVASNVAAGDRAGRGRSTARRRSRNCRPERSKPSSARLEFEG